MDLRISRRLLRVALAVFAALLLYPLFPRADAQPEFPDPTRSSTARLRERVDAFFSEISATTTVPTKPFETLVKGGPLEGGVVGGDLEKLKHGFDLLKKKYGRYVEHELIKETPVGNDLVIMQYLYKCEDHPIVWYFTFYRTTKSSQNWFVIDVRFDTNLAVLTL